MNPKFWITVAFLMSRIGVFQAAVQCPTAENSITGMFLRGHTFKTSKVGWPAGCYLMCEEEVTCQSYNFVIGQNLCELNNRTKEARSEDFKQDQTRFYMKRAKNRAPLGSIRELPAESCSEIKASEGNETANRYYWIYSDGNGQTILARCEGNWQKVNNESVCFGARNNSYGAFNITKRGVLKAMKLVHKSGSVKCNKDLLESYWGCRYERIYGKNGLMTIITNPKKQVILPAPGYLVNKECGKNFVYTLNGTTHKSRELVYRNLSHKVSVSRNQKMQIWFGQDWADCSEHNNDYGRTCVDMYAWYD